MADVLTARTPEPASPHATPRCPHFGTCGGCQYQDRAYAEQLHLKLAHLHDLLRQANIHIPPETTLHSAEPYHYRNRIRLRVERIDNHLRLGYNIRTTTDFLPIITCPIAGPALWNTAESLLTAAAHDRDAAFWLAAASEVELFCNHDQSQVQITLFCAPRTRAAPGSPTASISFARAFAAFQSHAPETVTITGAGAIAAPPTSKAPRSGPTGRTLAAAGAPGLAYTVAVPQAPPETYWITRGGFFQVNRFLLETLLTLVCSENGQPRTGALAWDLYAGVGLFSRILARSFTRITAVEANPVAANDLRRSLQKAAAQQPGAPSSAQLRASGTAPKVGSQDAPTTTAIGFTTLDFLRSAVLQRDRPDLIVLDPPRAGAGLEACALLIRIAAPTLIYVSCDPTTLARDLAALQPAYRIQQLHLVDLFPQTTHLETVAILKRK